MSGSLTFSSESSSNLKITDLLYPPLLFVPPAALPSGGVPRLLTHVSLWVLEHSFLVSIPPSPLAWRGTSADMLLARHLGKQRACTAGGAGEGDALPCGAGDGSRGSLGWHSWHSCTPALHPSGVALMAQSKQQPFGSAPGSPSKGMLHGSFLPAQSLERQSQVSPQWSLLQATGFPLRWKSVSWLGIDATVPFSLQMYKNTSFLWYTSFIYAFYYKG